MVRSASLSFALCVAVCGVSFAQEMPKPGPEHEKLKQFVGNWDAVMEMGGQKVDAKATYKSICGGMWLANEFEGQIAGKKFLGHGLDGYDLNKKKHVGIWVDSMSSAPLTFEGDLDPKTKLLTQTGEAAGPDGQPHKFKCTTEVKDPDHFT